MAALVVAQMLWACQAPEPGGRARGTEPGPTTTPTTDTAPEPTTVTPTASTGDTAPDEVEIDCTALSSGPLSGQVVQGGRGYHDVTFDATGRVIGTDGNNLVWADYYGNSGVLLPGTGTVQGLGTLPDGDFVAATDTNNSLFRFTDEGAVTLLYGDSGAYGVIVGPDGMVYTADYDTIDRIDPATGERTVLADPTNFSPKSIQWNRDYTKLLIGTGFGDGRVWAVDTDPVTLDVISDPYVYATGVGTGAYHDCLAVDWCDNAYVCDYGERTIYRISPQGQVSVYIDFLQGDSGKYAHGAEWGSGVGGFRIDALYISQPYDGNGVSEVVIGIPGRAWDGTGWTPEE